MSRTLNAWVDTSITHVGDFKLATATQANKFLDSLVSGHKPVTRETLEYLSAGLNHPQPRVVHDTTILIQSLYNTSRAGLGGDNALKLAQDVSRSPFRITQGLVFNVLMHEVRKGKIGETSAPKVKALITESVNHAMGWVSQPLDPGMRAAATQQEAFMLRSTSFLTESAVEKGLMTREEANGLAAVLQKKTEPLPEHNQLRAIARDFASDGRAMIAPQGTLYVDPDAAIRPAANAVDPQQHL